MTKFYRLIIQNLQASQEDLLTYDLFSLGASGVSEQLNFSQPTGSFQAEILESPVKNLEAYFEQEPKLESLLKSYPDLEFRIVKEENQDWMHKWKESWKAFSLVEPFWVVPSWETKDGVEAIYIDPGMAFGTGTHATTKLCAKALKKILSKPQYKSLIDVGCGTAILSILASKLGLTDVEATEIDEDARVCAKENIKRNHCVNILVHDKQIEDLNKKFDLVVANIIDPVLIKIQEDLFRLLQPDGILLVSGIIEERKDLFEAQFIRDKYAIVSQDKQEEWWQYSLKKL